MILTINHFLECTQPNITTINLDEFTHVHCFHATRLPSGKKDAILREGLSAPSVDWLRQILAEAGIPEEYLNPTELESTIEENGCTVFVQLNKNFLLEHGNYHKCGPEKLRRYINEHAPECRPKLKAMMKSWTGYLFELMLPIELIDLDELLCDLAESPEDQLHQNLETADVTLEVIQRIDPSHILDIFEV